MKKILSSVFLLFLFFGCAKKEIKPKFDEFIKLPNISQANFKIVGFSQIDEWDSNDFNKSLALFKKSCKKIAKKALFTKICQKAKTAKDSKRFFEKNFIPLMLFDDLKSNEGTITGYYEPLLSGSLTKTKKFKYPIYAVPKDLITVRLSSIYPDLKHYRLRGRIKGNNLIPYFTREEIEKNSINADVLCYVDNKIDLFFLQIQGSGKVRLEDNTTLNIAYANQNGHPFRSVASKLIKEGIIKPWQGSLQGFKAWLENNPKKIDEILYQNPSYVFFSISKKGATGSLGIELEAKKSIAVDRRYIPLGVPVFLETKNPLTKQPINTMCFAWDTGGAIKGKIRADYFWGFGKEAKKFAGRMKEKGKLIMFLPRDFIETIK